ncbi:MAG: hypothetical protein ACYC9M_03180 [Desulfobulbaceae bacterium]
MLENKNFHTHPDILSHEQLQSLSGYEQSARICEWLETNEIPYVIGKSGRVSTSLMAYNQALGVTYNIIYKSDLDVQDEQMEIEAV